MCDKKVLEGYQLIRDEIHTEHNQINSRMGWFVTHQTVLIGATVALLTEKLFAENRWLVLSFSAVIALTGLILTRLLSRSLWAAIHKLQILRANEKRYLPADCSDSLGDRAKWVHLLEEPDCPVPPWYAGSTEDINDAGLCYPIWAPRLVVSLWLVALAVVIVLAVLKLRGVL